VYGRRERVELSGRLFLGHQRGGCPLCPPPAQLRCPRRRVGASTDGGEHVGLYVFGGEYAPRGSLTRPLPQSSRSARRLAPLPD
jgi:hypothetical protein